MYLIAEVLMIISVGGLIGARQAGLVEWEIIFKSAASLFFVMEGFLGYLKAKKNRKVYLYIFLALIFSMGGDVFLALDTNKGIMFISGVASFAIAHIMFIIAFSKMSKIRKADFAVAGVIIAVLLTIMYVGTFNFKGLLPVIIAYVIIISFMVSKALSLWRCRKGKECVVGLMMAGGVFFLISDLILLFVMFGTGVPKIAQSVNLIVYYLGQLFQARALNISSESFSQE